MKSSVSHRSHFGQGWFATAPTAILLVSAVGCGTTQHDQPPARAPMQAPPAFIARPCQPLQQKAAAGAPVALLVQVASVSSPMQQPLRSWLADHAVEAHNVAGVLVEPSATGTSPWGECVDAACSENREARLTMRVQNLPADGSAPAVLEIEIASPGSAARRAVVQAGNQEPTLANLSGVAGESIVVTPYYLFDPKKESLALLHQCTSRDAQRPAASRDDKR